MQNIQQNRQTTDWEVLNIGAIGCGKHCVQSHLTKMGGKEAVNLSGIYDISINALVDLARFQLTPTSAFESEDELILSSVDAILVMTPDEFHADSLAKIVRAKKHVFVEKPLAVDSQQLDLVIEALKHARENNLIVSSCHPRRFDPPYVWLKNNLQALITELGPLSHVEFDFSYHKPTKEWKHLRGLLMDHANHEIDLVHWYLGHQPFSAWRLSDTPDHYHIVGIRDDSVHFSFNGSRQLESKVYREFVKLRFQRGTFTMDANLGEVNIHNHDTENHRAFKIAGINYDVRFRLINENFIQAIRGLAPNYLTTQDLYVNTALGVKLTEGETWRYSGEVP